MYICHLYKYDKVISRTGEDPLKGLFCRDAAFWDSLEVY